MSLKQDDIVKYKSLYVQTSEGYVNTLRKNITFLLKDKKASIARDSAHLAAHSLKSESLLMGYNQIGKLSEEMEKIFRKSHDEGFVLTKVILEIMLVGIKKVQISIDQISNNGQEVDMSEEINKLESI